MSEHDRYPGDQWETKEEFEACEPVQLECLVCGALGLLRPPNEDHPGWICPACYEGMLNEP